MTYAWATLFVWHRSGLLALLLAVLFLGMVVGGSAVSVLFSSARLEAASEESMVRAETRVVSGPARTTSDYPSPQLAGPSSASDPSAVTTAARDDPAAGSLVVASWYGSSWNTDAHGDRFLGNVMACGDMYRPEIVGVAHKTLPCGSVVTLSYGGQTVRITVVDRGPFMDGREFDLTVAARAALGCPDLCLLRWVR